MEEMPRVLSLDYGRPLHRNRSTAGSKERCVFCGRKTYRFVGNKAVCSYCSSNEKAKKIVPSWDRPIILADEELESI